MADKRLEELRARAGRLQPLPPSEDELAEMNAPVAQGDNLLPPGVQKMQEQARAMAGDAASRNSALLHGLQRGVTLGQDATIGGLFDTGLGAVMGTGSGSLIDDYNTNRQNRLAEYDRIGEQSPQHQMLGEFLGIAAPTGAAGAALHGMTQGLPKLAQHAAQGGLAAVEGLTYAMGTDSEDPLLTGLLSGVLGAAGSRVADAAPRLAQRVKDRVSRLAGGPDVIAQQQAAQSLLETVAQVSGRGGDPTEVSHLLARRRLLGDEATMADLSPELRTIVSESLGARTDPGLIGAARNIVNNRDIEEIAESEFARVFGNNIGNRAHQANLNQVRGELAQRYDEVIDGYTGMFDPMDLNKLVLSAFPENAAGQDYRLRSNLTTELGHLTGDGATALTARDVLTFQKIIDENISTTAIDGQPMHNAARRNLIELRKNVSDMLKQNVDGYADVAAQYADTVAVDRARKQGQELFLNNREVTDDLKTAFDNMSDLEKMAFAEGARQQLQVKFETGTSDRMFKRDIADRLEAVFGQQKAFEFLSAVDRVNTFEQTNRSLTNRSLAAIRQGHHGSSAGIAGKAADIAALTGAIATGRAQSGQAFGSGRRLAVDARRASEVRRDDEILSHALKAGDEADQAILDLQMFLLGLKDAAPASGAARGAAGGGAILESDRLLD